MALFAPIGCIDWWLMVLFRTHPFVWIIDHPMWLENGSTTSELLNHGGLKIIILTS